MANRLYTQRAPHGDVRDPEKLAAALERTLGPDSSDVEDAEINAIRPILERLRAEKATRNDVARVISFGLRRGLEKLLEDYDLPVPPFNVHKSFWENFYGGPPLDDFERLRLRHRPTKIADFEITFPFGVPSSALTPNHGFIRFFAERGFDLITYKTVRNQPRDAHEFPHWAFACGIEKPLMEDQLNEEITATMDAWPDDPSKLSMVNSFGVPSLPPLDWQEDIEYSKKAMDYGQALIVSVMGTPEEADSDGDLIQQFVEVASRARDAGADAIELNLSCPNTGGELIFLAPQLAAEVAKAVSSELRRTSTPTFIKIGYLNREPLKELVAMCAPHIDGIVAINTVQVPVADLRGAQFFPGKRERERAGISGFAIKGLAMDVAQCLLSLRESNRYDYAVIGVGGVTTPADFEEYMALGVDAVQSCTGAWLNPHLAQEIRGIDRDSEEPEPTIAEIQDSDAMDIGPLPGTGLADPFGRVGVDW